MSIMLSCEQCGKRYELSDTLAGKRVRCKQCSWIMRVDAQPSAMLVKPLILEDDEEPRPRRVRPSAPRRKLQGGRLPLLVKVGLGLIGGLMLVPSLLLSVVLLAAGHAEVAGPLLALDAFFAFAGLATVCHLKLVFMAEEASPRGGTAAFLNPVYMLNFISDNWEHTRRLTYVHIAGLAGVVVCFVFVPSYLQTLRRPGAGGVAGRGSSIQLVVTGASSDEDQASIGAALKALVDPADSSGFTSRSSGDQTAYNLWPVRDPAAFAKKISFGKVTRVSGRRIDVAADADAVAALPRVNRPHRPDANRAEFPPAQPPAQPGVVEAPAEPQPPAAADPLSRELFALTSREDGKKKEAIQRLGRMTPDDARRDEVQAALRPLLDHEDGFLVNDVIDAMASWRTEETVPALIPRTKDDRFGVRWHAIETLGNLGDPRAAGAIAGRLKDDGIKSVPALRALGPAAEPALIPLLRDPDPGMRRKACEILGEIGGKDTLAFMRASPPDPDLGVRVAAQTAYESIAARVGPEDGRAARRR